MMMGNPHQSIWDVLDALPPGSVYNPRDQKFLCPSGTIMGEDAIKNAIALKQSRQQLGGPVMGRGSLGGSAHSTLLAYYAQAQLQAKDQALAGQAFSQGLQQWSGQPSTGWVTVGVGSPPHNAWKKPSEQIVAGEIIGHRGWSIMYEWSDADGRSYIFLRSTAASYTWQPKQVAEGKPLDGYGIHAYKDPYRLMEEQRGFATVFGTIAMWGDVIEHDYGYRSQYARIVSIDYFSCGSIPYRKEIMERYL